MPKAKTPPSERASAYPWNAPEGTAHGGCAGADAGHARALRIVVEHRPRRRAHRGGAVGPGDLVVPDLSLVGPSYPATVIPTAPSGSSVTSGEFWNPRSGLSTVSSAPEAPSRTSTPAVVGTRTSWVLPPDSSATTTDPITRPTTGCCQMVAPVLASRTQTDPPDAGVGALDHLEAAVSR